MRNVTYLFFALLFSFGLSAQSGDNWTLERAVNYALTNNLQVRQLDNVAELSLLQAQSAKASRLPTLSASSNVGAQLGRTIDPTTNTFNQQTIGFQGYGINAGINIYNGGQIKMGIQQAEINYAAAKLDSKVTSNNIGLQVANSYLTIVLLEEQLKNAEAQLALSNDQLANTDALIKAGALPAAQRFDLLAQQAASKRSVVELENQVITGTLGLKILLELDYNAEFRVVTPELNPSEGQLFETYDLEEVFLTARTTQPTVAAAELRKESAAMGIELSKAAFRPTVSLFGSLSTNYSTAAKDFLNPEGGEQPTFQFGTPVPVQLNGTDAFLSGLEAVGGVAPTFPTLGYLTQLDRNFGQSIGASVNIPIYNQGRKKINVQTAKLQELNASLDVQRAQNNLRNDVQLALVNLRSAQQTYRAAEASQEAAQAAYDNAQRRFRAGTANSFDLVTATNQLEQARNEMTRSKYQLIFNRQVIRFYLGRGFSLE
ncbi:MAG: outer membrane protein [Neolewinella sp.]|jgi:outer membrane protein